MKRFLRILSSVTAFVSAAAWCSAAGFAQNLGSPDDPIEVMANSASYSWDSDWVEFTGNSRIKSNGNELRAQTIRFNRKTRDAEALGQVTFLGAQGEHWTGENLKVNLRNPKVPTLQTGRMTAYYNPFYVEAEKSAAKNNRYYAQNVTFTTCTNAPGHRHYELRAHDATIVPDDDLTAHGAVPYLFGVPFFYWPYFWKDLHNHYGFRFYPGYQSTWGAYLLSIYKFRMWRLDDENWGDSRTLFDMRSKRGIAYGERINWYSTSVGDGELEGYMIQDDYDKLEDEGVEDTERYRVKFEHEATLSDDDSLLLKALYVSDDRVMRDFFEDEYELSPQPENYASYTHTGKSYAFGALGVARLNDFYTQVERLPELWLNINQQEVGDATGVFYESETAGAFLRKRFDERVASEDDDYDAARLDTYHTFSYPLKLAGFLSVVPSLSYRGTYYSKTKETKETVEYKAETTTNLFGAVTTTLSSNTVTRVDEGGADFRNVLEFNLELSFKCFGNWTADDGTPWRHILEPYAQYTYIPEPNLVPEDLYAFDEIDEIDFTNRLRLGLRQHWQCKDVFESYNPGDKPVRVPREFLWLDIYGDILLEPEEDGDGVKEESFDSLYADVVWYPTSWITATLNTVYDNQESELSQITSALTLVHPKIRTTAEYVYRADLTDLVMGQVAWNATELWEFCLFGRYDFEEALVQKVGTYVQMNFDCIALRLIASVYPGYTRADGKKEEDDFRISFAIWERHFAPKNIDKNRY